ncbi:MAG: LysR substrate-binding domain-containing protein [Rickettsiales bacterium]
MNLRDMQYLVAVADHLHFGQAAEACHVSQPTLSMQLKKLEEFLDVRLFERSNKQVMLTPVGKDIVAHARMLLRESEQIKAIAKAATDPFAGELRLGVFPTLAPYVLPHVMPAIKKKFPKLSLLLIEEKSPELLGQLEHGTLEATLLALPVHKHGMSTKELFKEKFYLAVPSSHVFAAKKSVSYDDLKDQEMLLLDEGHCLRDQALEVCQTIGIGEAKTFRATSLETLRHMVAAGNAVTLIPALAATPQKGISYIPFAKPVPSRMIGLCWRMRDMRGALYQALGDVIAQTVQKQL